MNELEVYDSVPEPEHVETMIDGFTDMVNGTESYATRYACGVMVACGAVSQKEITGNEGFFSSIGDGLKKVWDYIMSMFKSVYDYFFKTESKAQDSSAKKAVSEATEAVKDPKIPTAKTKEAVAKVKAGVAKLPAGSKKTQLEAAVADAENIEDSVKKCKALEDIIPAVFEAGIEDAKSLIASAGKIREAMAKLELRATLYKNSNADGQRNWGDNISKFLSGIDGLPDALVAVKDLKTARAYLDKAPKYLESITNNLKPLEASESSFKESIKKIEASMKDAKNKEVLKKEITGLKQSLVSISGVVHFAGVIRKGIEAACTTINKNCITFVI